MEMNEFEKQSADRKMSVKLGDTPEFFTTQGYLLFKRKIAFKGESVKQAYQRVAKTLALHIKDEFPEAEKRFFNLMWEGKLAPSSPVLSNVGTGRGHPVSCSGGYIEDSIDSFYKNFHEIAMLSKMGYGTSSYLGAIRGRGEKISTGGEADGVVPVFDSAADVVNKVSQGAVRRGSWAGYLEVDHPDFYELAGYVQKHPSTNIGWIFTDNFIEKLQAGDKDAISRFNKVMYLRARTGTGYIWKVDTANKLAPQAIKNSGVKIKGSNLCSEIALPSNEELTFSCVLSSLNLAKWDEITEEDIEWCIIFLDCVVEEMLNLARGTPGFEKIIRFTEKSRALGLGTLGFATYLQNKDLAFEELQTMFVNNEIFKTIQRAAIRGSQRLAAVYGEPEWCKGTGQRNATLTAIAPNMSSSLLCGGVSQGIEPIVANAYNQNTSAGEMTRINPKFAEVAKKYGKYSDKLVRDIAINYNGSVQHLEWLSEKEKAILRTAYEMDQDVLVRLAASRQPYIDQGQSLNLFFPEDELKIANVVKNALLNPKIKGLYYQRSLRGVKGSTGECLSCHG